MDRRVIWSIDAQNSRRSIFTYWNARNKSKTYSKKLNTLFLEALQLVSILPEIGKQTELDGNQLMIVSHFQIIYKATNDKVIVFDLWDTRQNPQNFPIK